MTVSSGSIEEIKFRLGIYWGYRWVEDSKVYYDGFLLLCWFIFINFVINCCGIIQIHKYATSIVIYIHKSDTWLFKIAWYITAIMPKVITANPNLPILTLILPQLFAVLLSVLLLLLLLL